MNTYTRSLTHALSLLGFFKDRGTIQSPQRLWRRRCRSRLERSLGLGLGWLPTYVLTGTSLGTEPTETAKLPTLGSGFFFFRLVRRRQVGHRRKVDAACPRRDVHAERPEHKNAQPALRHCLMSARQHLCQFRMCLPPSLARWCQFSAVHLPCVTSCRKNGANTFWWK